DEKKKPARVRPEGEKKTAVLPPISRIKAPVPAPAPAAAPAPEPAQEPAEAAVADEEKPAEAAADSVPSDGKIIHIKPPVIVKELAAQLGLKPFQITKDLIDLKTFVNINQSIEADIAEAICKKHGFVFEKEKRHKGEGVHKPAPVVVPPKPVEKPKEAEL